MGEYRKEEGDIMYEKRKVYCLWERVKDIVKNGVVEVKYIWGNESKRSILWGLREREICDYVDSCGMVKGIELKMVEMKEMGRFNWDWFV